MKSFKALVIILLAAVIFSCNGGSGERLPDQKTDFGVPYEIVEEGEGKAIEQNDVIGAWMKYTILRNDSVYSSNLSDDEPAFFQASEPRRYGDPSDWFSLLSEGDSANFYLAIDSIADSTNRPPYFQKGDIIRASIKVERVMTMEEYQAYQRQRQNEKTSSQVAALKAKVDNLGITDYQETPDGLLYRIEEQGSGASPENGDVVKLHYVGRLFNGDTFESSYKRGKPVTFTVGSSQVVGGWHKGLPYFREGGKGTLYLPPALGYGEQGAGPIPPNSSLIFDIEVVEVKDAEAMSKEAEQKLKSYLNNNNIDATRAPEGYYYIIDEKGSGPKPKPGQTVQVHYTGYLLDGTKFDSSVDRGEPIEFPLGQGRVIPGWDKGLQQFPVGSKGRLFIPPNLGYGSSGQGPIPANSVLIFEVELIGAQ